MSKARDLANAGTALTTVSATELGYVDGVTSAIQTQIDSKEATLPSQTGNSGKYLTTDGSSKSWAAVTTLPSQTGNSGKYLTTDGTTASWGTITTDRTNSNWLRTYDYYSPNDASMETINNGIAKDSSGNIYTIGTIKYPVNNAWNMLLLNKYNSIGEELSSIIIYNTTWRFDPDYPKITIDSSGNIYLSGMIYDGTTYNGFVMKLSSTFTITWAKHINSDTGGNGEYVAGVDVDSSGNVYYCGVVFTTKSVHMIGKLDSSGNSVWTRRITETNASGSYASGIKLDSSGNVYVIGRAYRGTTNANDAVIVKYDSSGTLQWKTAALTTGTGTDWFFDLAVDSSGNSYAVGYGGSAQVGIIAKFDTSGTIQWSKSLSGLSNGAWYGVFLDSTSLYVVGQMGTLNSNQTNTATTALAKYDTSGNLQWQRVLRNGTDGAYLYACTVSGSYLYASGRLKAKGAAKSASVLRIKTDGTSSILDGSAFTVDGQKVLYQTSTYTDAASPLTTVAWASGTDSALAPTFTSWTPSKENALGSSEIGYFN